MARRKRRNHSSAFKVKLGPDEDFHTSVTLLGKDITESARRDYGFGLPSTEDPTGILGDLNEFPDGFYQPGTLVPDGCDPQTKCNNVETIPGEGIGVGSRHDLVEYSCRDAFYPVTQSDARVAHGYMVGWIGESTSPPLQHSTSGDDSDALDSLGSLYGVCAPWSSASYLYNWSALRFVGFRRAANEVLFAPLEQNHDYFGSNLTNALPSMFEVSKKEWLSTFKFLKSEIGEENVVTNPIDMLRPPSMQFCPPGSALRGIQIGLRHCEASDGCPNFDPSPANCPFQEYMLAVPPGHNVTA